MSPWALYGRLRRPVALPAPEKTIKAQKGAHSGAQRFERW